MAYINGRLPQFLLAPITKANGGAQVYLRKDAARAFNAMNAESEARFGVTLRALGSMSAYRNRWQQEYLWNNVPHARDTNWVARPGTSNHGWGLAIDLATPRMRQIIDQIGEKYGFAKKWSDAPKEWWHIKWKAGTYSAVTNSKYGFKVLRRGQTGPTIVTLKKLLYNKGLRGFGSRYNPYFNKATEDKVKQFQKRRLLHSDGVVGPKTWEALKRKR